MAAEVLLAGGLTHLHSEVREKRARGRIVVVHAAHSSLDERFPRELCRARVEVSRAAKRGFSFFVRF